MKTARILLITAILASTQVIAQEPVKKVSLTKPVSAKCYPNQTDPGIEADANERKKISFKKEDKKIIDIEFANAADVAADKFQLKSLKSGKTANGTLSGKIYRFDLTELLEGVDESVLFQLADKKKPAQCYNFILQADWEQEKPDIVITVPDLLFSNKTPQQSPCDACVTEGAKVEYDFEKNKLAFTNGSKKYPRVNGAIDFTVVNVNPFKYDISMSDETRNHNTDAPALFTRAFTPSTEVSAVAADTPDSVKSKKKLSLVLNKLQAAILAKIEEYTTGPDCKNPCSRITEDLNDIAAYLERNMGMSKSADIVAFLGAEVASVFDPITDTTEIKNAKEAIATITNFRSKRTASFSYRVPQVQNVDQYLFKLNITPKANTNAAARVSNQEIAVDIMGGFKIDFSSGLYISKLTEDKFLLRGDSTVIKTADGYNDSIVYNRRNLVIKEAGRDGEFGLAALMHMYPKQSPGFNVAFSLGAGVSIAEKPRLRYLTGLSILIGKTNRLGITGGMAMGFTERLSDKYVPDNSGMIITSSSATSVDVKKAFRVKSFAALTYSIPLVKKTEAATPAPKAEDTGSDTSEGKEDEGKEDPKKDKN